MESNTPVIRVNTLSKRFGSFRALDNVNLSLDQGDVFYLLGPNGSGKTTLINCILALSKPEKGTIHLWGSDDLVQMKSRVGVVLEDDGFFRDLSVEKNLQIVCLLKNASFEEIPQLLEQFWLIEHRKKLVRKLSLGLRKRLAIACSLIGNPDLLIWDEPYNGLDPTGFLFMRSLIQNLQGQGKTLFVSSHLLDEVNRTATKLLLINKGRVGELMPAHAVSLKYKTIDAYYLQHINEPV